MPVKIANYEILKLLGQGSMGQVYLARDSLTDNRVALKLMRALELTPNSDERAAHLRGLFTREGTVSIKFEHPHLISVLDFGEHEGVPFIAMEYFDGYALDAWITRGRINLKPLSFSEKLRIALQITEGVAYLHTNGILHRDIKPANVLVSDNLNAKVADFGLVKPVEGAALLAGTLAYISPECLHGAPATFQSDVYALGITLVELFAGYQFGANKRQIPLESLIGSEHPDFLWSLAAVLRKSIEGEPDRRFASASEFHDAIQRCLSEFESNRPLIAWAAQLFGAQRLRKEI